MERRERGNGLPLWSEVTRSRHPSRPRGSPGAQTDHLRSQSAYGPGRKGRPSKSRQRRRSSGTRKCVSVLVSKDLNSASFSNLHFERLWLLCEKRLERGLKEAGIHGDGG